MYAPQNLTKCLPLLAAILGDSYGINIVIGNFPTGATDKKTVYIPAMAAATSDWANNLLRFLIDHECAHVRYSDFDVLKGLSPVVNSFRNILEDYRVENRMVSHYPGCRDHFDWGILNFIFGDGPDMTIAPEPLDIHNWVLGYVRSWDVPSLEPKVAAEAAWLENTYAGLMGPLTKLLDEAHAAWFNRRRTAFPMLIASSTCSIILSSRKHRMTKRKRKQTRKSWTMTFSKSSRNFCSQRRMIFPWTWPTKFGRNWKAKALTTT